MFSFLEKPWPDKNKKRVVSSMFYFYKQRQGYGVNNPNRMILINLSFLAWKKRMSRTWESYLIGTQQQQFLVKTISLGEKNRYHVT